MTNPIIVAQGVKKSFWIGSSETQVLKGVDLTIEPAGLMAIIGASGAGKSTLLHILGSLDRPTEGTVLFEGENLYRNRDEVLSALRNRAIGFVFQFHHLMPEFTALENVMLPLLMRSKGKSYARKDAVRLLEELGLEGRMHHRPTELSGGEQQRVAVARALVTGPKILFADEPTGNLDHENGERLMELLLQVHRERKTALVLVTHNAAITARFPKKVHLEDGRIGRVEG